MATGLFQLRCNHCQHSERLDLGAAIVRLRNVGHLRRGMPDAEMVSALSATVADKLRCEACGQCGVQMTMIDTMFDLPCDAGDWPVEVRSCRNCRQQIALERLQVFPQTQLCAKCQHQEDLGPDAHYCPHCGSHLRIEKAPSGGITRYQERCDHCGYRG